MRSLAIFFAATLAIWATTVVAEPRIAIVIDDVGVHVPNGWRVVALPGPLTLALMTYAKDLDKLAAESLARGHELLLHIPMEPTDQTWDTGPNALRLNLDAEEFQRRLDWAFDRFDGYVGINNHMGSRFTEDSAAMARLMATLAPKGLFFLDSLTSTRSMGEEAAQAEGVAYLARDVFLDNVVDPEAVWSRLAELERIALARGFAIGIAHPKGATIQVLAEWIPTLAERGITLVPVSQLLPTPVPGIVAEAD
jgi:polysaccharide deacetylase 2 family uncharacterized protein YibQ